MKTVIDLDGNEIQVADDTVVRTATVKEEVVIGQDLNGNDVTKLINVSKHYLLSSEEQDAIAQKEVAEQNRQLLAKPEELRKKLSLGTVTVNGVTVRCNDATLGSIASTIMFFDKLGGNAPSTVAWKAENGFFDVTPAQVNQLGLAVFNKRQKMFSSAKTVEAEVADGTLTTLAEVTARYNELMEA